MSSVIIAGNTSGTITLDAPNVAGTTTLTLPTTNGTILTTANTFGAGTGPAFSVYLSTSQTISNNVTTKVAFNSENFDTASCFNTSTYRFTPTTAGYYSFSVIVQPQSNSAISGYSFYLTKNGADVGSSNQICYANGNNGYSLNPAYNGSLMYYLNGSTDFVELYFNQGTGSSKLLYGSVDGGTTILSGFLARSA